MLLQVPLINQLHEPTTDGMPDENAGWNCVPTTIASASSYILGQPLNGDMLKDAVYGQGYQGGMAAVNFVAYCLGLGVDLVSHKGNQDELIALVRESIANGRPCLMTIPSKWAYPPNDALNPSGTTHVVLACGIDNTSGDTITAMNPWGGFLQEQSSSWWHDRLCFGEVWSLAKHVEVPTMAIPNTWLLQNGTLFGPADTTGTRHTVFKELAGYILAQPSWDAGNVPVEDPHSDGNGGTEQILRDDMYGFTKDGMFFRGNAGEQLAQQRQAAEKAAKELATNNNTIGDLGAQLAAAQATIAQLQAQLQQPSQPPQSPPTMDLHAAFALVSDAVSKAIGVK